MIHSHLLSSAALSVVLFVAPASAQLVMTLSGESDSPIIQYSLSGSSVVDSDTLELLGGVYQGAFFYLEPGVFPFPSDIDATNSQGGTNGFFTVDDGNPGFPPTLEFINETLAESLGDGVFDGARDDAGDILFDNDGNFGDARVGLQANGPFSLSFPVQNGDVISWSGSGTFDISNGGGVQGISFSQFTPGSYPLGPSGLEPATLGLTGLLVIVPVVPGDANGDGAVDLVDLDILGQNFGTMTTGGAADGDFNGDGEVTLLDLDILGANFGAGAASIPEPGTAALLMVGLLALRRRV